MAFSFSVFFLIIEFDNGSVNKGLFFSLSLSLSLSLFCLIELAWIEVSANGLAKQIRDRASAAIH